MRQLLPFLLLPVLARADSFDELFKLPVLYKNPDSRFLREFSLAANVQWQWAEGDSDRGNFGTRDRPGALTWSDDIEVRRMELGFRAQLGDSWKFQAKIDANPSGELDSAADRSLGHGFYRDLHDISLIYSYSPALNLGIGKVTSKFFTYENSTSSSEIIVFERSLLVETLIPKDLTGVWVNGTKNHWLYGFAVYAGDYQPELPEFDAGFVTQTSIGYDFSESLGYDKAIVKFDHQYGSSAENSNGSGKFEQAFSLNTLFKQGPFTLYTDLLAGLGRGEQGDVIGITLTPSYHLTEDLELIFRYQHANGSDDGLQLLSRYERLAPDLTNGGRGGSYDAAYLGLNYYLHGHKLKLMAGAEYNRMRGGGDGGSYEGVTSLAGIRLSF